MSGVSLVAFLLDYGHMLPGDDVDKGVASFQDFFQEELDSDCKKLHGRRLHVDGDAGPATLNLMDRPRCGCPDKLPMGGPMEANWPEGCRDDLQVHWQREGLNLPAEDVDKSFLFALRSWSAVIDVGFVQVENRHRAQIWSTNGPLSGSTLAWSYLAQNTCNARLEQRYNTRTRWDRQYLQAVVAHEYGHALGSGHLRSPEALMYPYARRDVFKPSRVDIDWFYRLGYENPEPEPPEPPEDRVVAEVRIDGEGVHLAFEDGTERTYESGM